MSDSGNCSNESDSDATYFEPSYNRNEEPMDISDCDQNVCSETNFEKEINKEKEGEHRTETEGIINLSTSSVEIGEASCSCAAGKADEIPVLPVYFLPDIDTPSTSSQYFCYHQFLPVVDNDCDESNENVNNSKEELQLREPVKHSLVAMDLSDDVPNIKNEANSTDGNFNVDVDIVLPSIVLYLNNFYIDWIREENPCTRRDDLTIIRLRKRYIVELYKKVTFLKTVIHLYFQWISGSLANVDRQLIESIIQSLRLSMISLSTLFIDWKSKMCPKIFIEFYSSAELQLTEIISIFDKLESMLTAKMELCDAKQNEEITKLRESEMFDELSGTSGSDKSSEHGYKVSQSPKSRNVLRHSRKNMQIPETIVEEGSGALPETDVLNTDRNQSDADDLRPLTPTLSVQLQLPIAKSTQECIGNQSNENKILLNSILRFSDVIQSSLSPMETKMDNIQPSLNPWDQSVPDNKISQRMLPTSEVPLKVPSLPKTSGVLFIPPACKELDVSRKYKKVRFSKEKSFSENQSSKVIEIQDTAQENVNNIEFVRVGESLKKESDNELINELTFNPANVDSEENDQVSGPPSPWWGFTDTQIDVNNNNSLTFDGHHEDFGRLNGASNIPPTSSDDDDDDNDLPCGTGNEFSIPFDIEVVESRIEIPFADITVDEYRIMDDEQIFEGLL